MEFQSSLMGPIKKEILNDGGASNAFMFMTHDKSYIVKTTSLEEMNTLCSMIGRYAQYINDHPVSFKLLYDSAHG